MALLTKNPKTIKSDKASLEFATRIMHLAPHSLVSNETLCSHSTKGCRSVCLYYSGRGRMPRTMQARILRTRQLVENPLRFFCKLIREVGAFERQCKRNAVHAAVRLNGTSDIPWEEWKLGGETLFTLFPNVLFYDYTKIPSRMLASLRGDFPPNYYLLFSLSETRSSLKWAGQVLYLGGNVAVVFHGPSLPTKYFLGSAERDVIDGDKHDLRFADPKRVIIGLLAKGPGVLSDTPFIKGEIHDK